MDDTDNAQTSMRMDINVGPASQRSESNGVIAQRIRRALAGQVAGVELRVQARQGQFLLERLLRGSSGLTVEVRGEEFETLRLLAEQAETMITDLAGVADVESDVADLQPQEHLIIDRIKLDHMGLTVDDVASFLELAVNSRTAGDFRPAGDSVPMRIRFADIKELPLEQLLQQQLRTPDGSLVALNNILRVQDGFGPSEITRRDRQRTITLDVNVDGQDEGTVAQERGGHSGRLAKPPGYSFRLAGSYAEQQQASRDLSLGFY